MRCLLASLSLLAWPALAGPPIVPFEVPAEPGIRVETVASGLEHPWALAFLPDGRMLVSERPGRLRFVGRDGRISAPVRGVPSVAAFGQGGLLDVALAPDFATSGTLYFTHSVGTEQANMIALSRARLAGNALLRVTEIARNPVAKSGGAHFGSRLLFLPDGSLLMSVGDGGNPNVKLAGANIRNQAQNPRTWFGKTLRLTADGKPAAGNPGTSAPGWDPHVWTIGHRNIQGLARDPKTGAIYATEHGAQGGDELNRLLAGSNYGWPLVTYSIEYSGKSITSERTRPGMVDPLSVWTPSIAASGLAVYRGTAMPGLDGALLAGGLMSQDVRIIRLGRDGQPQRETRIEVGARVRDVRVGPDGFVYVLTDDTEGKLLRLRPAR
ncbi:PQQ-dependent sugar dehydrogenase [Thermaurantiacus sp.]